MRPVIAVAILIGAGRVAAQAVPAANVPAQVQQALQAKYPGLASVTWKLTASKEYVAAFHVSGASVSSRFTAAGSWSESRTAIGAINLPEPVRSAIIRRYRGYQFAETVRLDRANAPVQVFEVHLTKPDEKVTVKFLPSGEVYGGGQRAAGSP